MRENGQVNNINIIQISTFKLIYKEFKIHIRNEKLFEININDNLDFIKK